MVKTLRSKELMWISKINRKMSIQKFRDNVKSSRLVGQDYSRILKHFSSSDDVYEVTVETWTKGDVNIWVPKQYVQTTGEMLTRFLDTNKETEESTIIENDVTISDLIDDENEMEKETESVNSDLSETLEFDTNTSSST